MRRFFQLLLLLLLGAGLLASCVHIPPAERFPEANQKFVRLLRWQDFDGAAHSLAEPYRSEFLHRFRALGDLHIVDVQPESVNSAGKKNRMVTWTVMQYYLLPSIAVKKFRFRLKWRYFQNGPHQPGIWRIVSPFPPFP